MKEKFINLCKTADLIMMGGIPLRYLPTSNVLCYRVMGDFNYISLDNIDDSSFKIDKDSWIIHRYNAVFRFKFYTEMPTE